MGEVIITAAVTAAANSREFSLYVVSPDLRSSSDRGLPTSAPPTLGTRSFFVQRGRPVICKMPTGILGLHPLCQPQQPPARPVVTVSWHCRITVPGGGGVDYSGLKPLFQGPLPRGAVPLQYYSCPHVAVGGTAAQGEEINC